MPPHSKRSRSRREADRLLLAAPGDGWVDEAEVKRVLAEYVMPGVAHRVAAKTRKTDSNARHQDPQTVGANRKANHLFHAAIQRGMWQRSACKTKVRHRDWTTTDDIFVIPTLVELDGLSRLLLASDWEKAAIVAAHVEVDNRPGPRSVNSDRSLTPAEFAAKGIAKLTSKNTVRRYVKAWMTTVGTRPEPGKPVELPTVPFPAMRDRDSQDYQPDDKPSPATLPTPKPKRVTVDSPGEMVSDLLKVFRGDYARTAEYLRDASADADRRWVQHTSDKRKNRQRKRTRSGAEVIQIRKRA